MHEDAIVQYITDTFEDIHTFEQDGTWFFFYDPRGMFPFTTLVTNDAHDQYSDLNRPSVFRLNIGVSKATFQSFFGTNGGAEREYDFTALDQLMPHPVYGKMYWVCVLNPSPQTFQTVIQPLLAEAYAMAVKKYGKPAERA